MTILSVFSISFFALFLLFRIIEPTYIFIFNKPLFVYFHPIKKKLKSDKKKILEAEFTFYNQLFNKKKAYFEHRVKTFIHHYEFIGKENLVVTNEMKILIAGSYVMLTFGMRHFKTDLFDKIIIFPSYYYSSVTGKNHKGEFNPRMKAVVFSWEDFKVGHESTTDNINLGLHEFSHVLHFHCLRNNDASAVIFQDAFEKVIKYYTDPELNKNLIDKAYLRQYAYENKFEFISVVLEHFFETPQKFELEFPDLYNDVKTMINYKS